MEEPGLDFRSDVYVRRMAVLYVVSMVYVATAVAVLLENIGWFFYPKSGTAAQRLWFNVPAVALLLGAVGSPAVFMVWWKWARGSVDSAGYVLGMYLVWLVVLGGCAVTMLAFKVLV